jgi:hypothetical protein
MIIDLQNFKYLAVTPELWLKQENLEGKTF